MSTSNSKIKPVKASSSKTEKQKPKMVLVACPNNRAERSEYAVNAMFAMGWTAAAYGIKAVSYTFDEHPISLARNAAMELFEKNPQFTHLLFIDSDILPPPAVINILIEKNVPVVSGWYLARKGVGTPLVFKLDNESVTFDQGHMDTIRYGKMEFPNFKPYELKEMFIMPKTKDGLSKVDGVGAGCLLLSREILPHLSKPYFYEDHLNFKGFGEDLWFALNCKVHGVPIYVDTSMFCAHVKWGIIDMRQVQALIRHNQMVEAQKRGEQKNPLMPPTPERVGG